MAMVAGNTVERMDALSNYVMRKSRRPDIEKVLNDSCTLYVGNLGADIRVIFEILRAGEIKRIVMGLDRFEKTPCGFCFVEYYSHQDALDCMKYINLTKLDERIIRTDIDPGFEEGRQYGRGASGGQVRDEFREDYDAGRGGYGRKQRVIQEYDMP